MRANETLLDARRRKESALANLRQLQVAREEGQLVSADFEAAMAAMIGRARTRLLAIPSKLAAAVAPESNAAVCEKLIRAEIYQALSELAKPEDQKKEK